MLIRDQIIRQRKIFTYTIKRQPSTCQPSSDGGYYEIEDSARQ